MSTGPIERGMALLKSMTAEDLRALSAVALAVAAHKEDAQQTVPGSRVTSGGTRLSAVAGGAA